MVTWMATVHTATVMKTLKWHRDGETDQWNTKFSFRHLRDLNVKNKSMKALKKVI